MQGTSGHYPPVASPFPTAIISDHPGPQGPDSPIHGSCMKLLAFDTSTEQLSIAVQHGDRVWCHRGPGGAQASTTLLPAIMALLNQAGLSLPQLDALVVGRGPGSFTGLRTACAVVQGLAFGADRPVLALDTLLALAQSARLSHPQARRALAVLDARMGQLYVAAYEWHGSDWITISPPALIDPQDLAWPPNWLSDPEVWVVGNARALLAPLPHLLTTPAGLSRSVLDAWPDAQALLDLAPAAWARGEAIPADQVLPLYLRDKVAQTTAERAALKAAASAIPSSVQAATP